MRRRSFSSHRWTIPRRTTNSFMRWVSRLNDALVSIRCLAREVQFLDSGLSPSNGLLAAQYQDASSCKTEWCASNQVLQQHLADLRASNWRAGKQPEFLYALCLQGWG